MSRLEEFDDVQLDVEFTQAGTRSNLTSNENIAISLGKISKWYEALVPTGGSSGQFLAWNSDGTAKWVANPNTDTKVTSTLLAQSTAAATYLPTFVSAAGNSGVNIMNSFSFRHTVGTTSDVGNSRIVLGNATASGTANNEEGQIILYSSSTSYHTIKGSATASTVTHSLPTTGGTILNTGTTSFTQTLTSGTKIGSIKINGTSTDIYCETNTNTDTKVTDTVGTANTYYPAGGTSTSTATGTQVFDTSLKFIGTTGTTSAVGKAQLVLGNSTASGTANNKQGSLVVYGSTAYAHTIQGAPTAARTLTLPDKAGTFALTSDIPSVPTVNDAALTLKGAGTTVTTFTANASSAKSLDIVAGSNVTVTADATNSNITIAAKDTVTTVTTSGSGNAVTAITASNGALTVTKGSTFLTSHQRVTDGNPTLSWGNQSTVATIGSTDIHVTMPANPNTDTKVTSTANHYAPATVSGQDKSASATGATAAWSIDVVKGVTLNTDGKGHVTGISVTSGKIPGNPVPSNNVTGSGTSGYLTKWNGTHTITNGPQLGSSTTTFLRNDGTWATPTNTTYSAGNHLTLSSTTFKVADYCKNLNGGDWNTATTNGWYMGASCTNAPDSNWWMGRVVAHNNKYCIQEVWNFNVSAPDNDNPDAMYMSHKRRWFRGENWGPWVDVSTPTPSEKVNCDFGTVASRTTNVTRGWIAHWDGAYKGTSSNLTYCNRGAFGTIVTKSTTDYSKVSITRNLTSGTKVGTITIDGTATDLYCQTNTNTTYTIATGDSNGQIKVTPSSGSAYNVSVKGLGSAAYTASTSYVPINGKAPNGIGRDGYVAYAHDGFLNTGTGTVTGALVITTPFTKTKGEVMLKFTVDIFNYNSNTSVEYKISGYAYNDGKWYNCTAYCVSSGVYSTDNIDNLTVRFGYVTDGFYQVQIGETTTNKWQYPRINIHDITVAYTRSSYTDANSGWSVEFVTGGNISNITQTITNTAQRYLPLSGGTMTGDITFASISGNTYPISSKGIKWGGGTDAIDMYYNLRESDAGELIINMRDDSNVRISFAYNGTVKSYIDTNGTYNGNASTATKTTQDGDGNTISSTYLKLSGGTMTGAVNFANNTMNKLGDDVQFGDGNVSGHMIVQGLNNTTGINLKYASDSYTGCNMTVTTKTRANSQFIGLYDDNKNGTGVVIGGGTGGLMLLGGGESPINFHSIMGSASTNPLGAAWAGGTENTLITADGEIYFMSGADNLGSSAHTDWTNCKTIVFDASGNFNPTITNKGSVGTSSKYWATSYITTMYGQHKRSNGGSWISARTNAAVWSNSDSVTGGSFYPATFSKTKSGGWAMGTLGNDDSLIFSYTTDTDFSSGANTSTYTIYLPKASGTVALTNHTHSYLPLSGGTMTGTITHPANTVAINLRADGASTWQNTIMTQNAGDEAVVFANANARTSWMFVNGEDSIAHPESNRWQSLTPALQIKGGCVAIGKLIPSGTTPTTRLDIAGSTALTGDIQLKTSGSSSDDSGDIVWYYGNGQEKARLWQDNTYTAKAGPAYRIYKSDGTSLYSGRLPLADGTSASGTWGISITGNAATATRADYVNVVASNEIRFYNDNQFKANNHLWLGYSWAQGSHYTPSGGSDTSSMTAPNITKFLMGNCSGGGLASVHAKTFILGNGSSPTSSSKTTTIATAATTTDRTITLPDASGTVALLTKGSTSYWGMIDGDGATSGWIRTTANGLIAATAVSLANGGDGALGTSSWAFKEAYIAKVRALKHYGWYGQKTNDTRQTTANLTCGGNGAMQLIIVSSSLTTGRPDADGYIMDFDWDNTGPYKAQLFIPNSAAYKYNSSLQWRYQTGSSDWSSAACAWRNVLDANNLEYMANHSTEFKRSFDLDMPMSPILRSTSFYNRANRFALIGADKIVIQYSSNNGSTWTDMAWDTTDDTTYNKSILFNDTINAWVPIGPRDSSNRTTSMKTRIIVTVDDRDVMVDQFLFQLNSAYQKITVTLEASKVGSADTFETLSSLTIDQWDYQCCINTKGIRFTPSSGYYAKLRITLGYSKIDSNHKTSVSTVLGIAAYSGIYWGNNPLVNGLMSMNKSDIALYDRPYAWMNDGTMLIPVQLKIFSGNYGTFIRNDGTSTYFLLTHSGYAQTGSWNSLRPLYFSNSTGFVTMENGASISSSAYGALSIKRTNGAYNAGIKFYNNGSTYLGSLAIDTVNGTFHRFKTDESTMYEIIDRSVVRNNTTVGTLGWTSASADTVIPTVNTIAHWNGAYSGRSSNLAYCKQGAFGTIVTKNTGDYLSSTTKYAGSSSAGGAATSANKLNTDAGSTSIPVYFSGGVPVQCTTPNAYQTDTTTNADYRVLFSTNANDTTQSGTTRKNINLQYNPSTATLKIGDYVSGSTATKTGKLVFGNSLNVYTHTINTNTDKLSSVSLTLNSTDGIMGTDALCYKGYEDANLSSDTVPGSLADISSLSNAVSFSGYLARFSYFTVLLCVGTDVTARTTVQVSAIAGYQSYQLIWGGAPNHSGGNLSITSGLVNITESSGTITLNFGKCASYWQFSSSSSTPTKGTTPNIHVLKVYGHSIRSNGYH